MDLKFHISEETTNKWSVDDKLKICSVIDDILKKLSPSQNDGLKKLENLVSTLKFRHILSPEIEASCESNRSFFTQICNESLKLLEAHQANDAEILQIFLQVFEISLALLKDSDIATSTLVTSQKHLSDIFNHNWSDGPITELNKALTYLHLFNVVLNTIPDVVNFKSNDLEELLLNLCSCTIPSISSFTTTRIIPKAVKKSPELKEKIWKVISSQAKTQRNITVIEKDSMFMLLCSVIEFYLPEKFCGNEGMRILEQNEFWIILQCGITNKDQAIRKQARYLLKRALDFISINNLLVNAENFQWTQESLIDNWNKFFLIIETLEEKQVHIVKQIFPLIENIFNLINTQWALCVLHRVINHDHNFVIKWGVSYFLKLQPCSHSKVFIVHHLLPVLNNTLLYQSDSEMMSEISLKLQNLFHTIALQQDVDFFKNILQGLHNISWAPLPLFHIVHAMGKLPSLPAWDQDDLLLLKKFILDATASQSIFLRGSAQSMLLRAILSLTNTENCDIAILADILSCFNNRECFKRGYKDWDLTKEWLNMFVSTKTAEEFLIKYITYVVSPETTSEENLQHTLGVNAISRMFVLLCDANLIDEEVFISLLQIFIPHLDRCENRLYINEDKVNKSLNLLVHLIDECYIDRENNVIILALQSTVAEMYRSNVLYLHSRLNSTLTIYNFHAIQLYGSVLKTLSKCLEDIEEIFMHAIDCGIIYSSVTVLEQSDPNLALQQYFAATVLEWCSEFIITYQFHDDDGCSTVQKILEDHIIAAMKAHSLNMTYPRPEGSELTRDLQTLWGHVASGQLKARWSTICNLLQIYESTLHHELCTQEFMKQATIAIEVGGPEILPPVMSTLKHFLHKEGDTNIVKSLLQTCYALSFEHRKTELFWVAIREFVGMTFNKSMFQRLDIQDILMEYVVDIYTHSQVIQGLFNLMTEQLCSIISPDWSSPVPIHTIACGLLFGPVMRKEQKINHQTFIYIKSLEDIPSNHLIDSQCDASVKVRVQCIRILLDQAMLDKDFIEKTAREVLRLECVRASRKARYFAESQMHFNRLRAAQTLLILEPFLSEDLIGDLLKWSCGSLVDESHQPSVRYLLEWLIARILLHHSTSFESIFLATMKQASSKRQGSISSFISVMYLWVLGLVEDSDPDLARVAAQAMQLILPWTMAQHYNIRLYAQVALLRVWFVTHEFGLTEITDKFEPLREGLQASLDQGNAVKNAVKLQEDFFFSAFFPNKHFTLETIYYELPRLSNVGKEEWILPEKFECNSSPINTYNVNTLLKGCKVASWILKSTGGSMEDEEEDGCGSIVQRKVTPWKDMVPDYCSRELKRKETQSGLVVVASLVDRAPNLGGLARTCEVFAASELVIHNMKVIEDQLFQSLSVSAEKWINISEVKPHQLSGYLIHMKNEGYTLVAAEQTSQSIPLQSLDFPKKTLLLLGNEKEGIPAEILPLLDICVEVPQQGVVRSLNVHVTGAIFIWQYYQQHNLVSVTKI